MDPTDYLKAHKIRDKARAIHQPHSPAALFRASELAVERDALQRTTGCRRLPHGKVTRAGSAVSPRAAGAGGVPVSLLAELAYHTASLASLRIAADPDGFFAQADQDGLSRDAWDRACAGVLGDVEPALRRRLFDQLDYAKRGRVSKDAFLQMRAAIRLFLEGAKLQDMLVELLAGLVATALSKTTQPREDGAGDACTEQTLAALTELSEEEMRPALSTLALSLKEHGVQRKREREERARKIASLTADQLEGKFAHLPTAAYGNKDAFHKGLEIIGLPHPHVRPEMAREFLEGPDAQDEFTAWNSGENRTFALKEWWFVVEPFVMSSVSAHRPPEKWELKFEYGGNRVPVRLEVFLHVLSAWKSARVAGASGRIRFGDYKLAATLDEEDPRWLHEKEVDMVQVVLCRYVKSQLDAISLTNALETTPRQPPPPQAAAKAHRIVRALEQGLRAGGDGAACTCTFASLVAAVVREGAATQQELEAILEHFHARFATMPISEPEVIASRLYTGPPFVKMNGPLREASRAFPKEWTEHLKGNKYTNTVYTCNSMLIKFSQISRIPPRRVVYRGISGVKLPPQFLVVAEGGGRGGVDFGFLSTSTSKEVAVSYLGGKDVPVLFQIEVGDIDRGAALSFLSQYPMEDEILFPPLSYIEVVGEAFPLETDKGSVSCYPCRINCNLKGRTIEEIDAHRQKEVTSLIPYLGNELWRDLPPVVAALAAQLEANGNEGVAEARPKLLGLQEGIERDFDALRADMEQPEKAQWLNQDTHYKEAMVTLIEFKHHHLTRLVKEFSTSENTHQNMTGLIVAAKEGWTKVVEALLGARAPVDARDGEQWTSLHYASRHGHTAVVQLLLQGGADIEARNKWSRTSLHLAALYGHSAVVRTLLENGADLEARNKSNLSALDFALQKKEEAVVKALAEHSILVAAAVGDTELVAAHIGKGVDLAGMSARRMSALMLACVNGHDKIAKMLLEAGSKPELTDKHGKTALMLACACGHEAAATQLLDPTCAAGALDVVGVDGFSALLWAEERSLGAVTEMLRERGAAAVCRPALSLFRGQWSTAQIDVGERTVTFDDWSTVRSTQRCPLGGKAYFELEILEVDDRYPQWGFSTAAFEPQLGAMPEEGVGDSPDSWAVDGTRQIKFHGDEGAYKCVWKQGDVVGLACDLDAMQIHVSVNGSCKAPNGLVFELDRDECGDGLFAAFSSGAGKVRYNLGEVAFKHAPPMGQYQALAVFGNQ